MPPPASEDRVHSPHRPPAPAARDPAETAWENFLHTAQAETRNRTTAREHPQSRRRIPCRIATLPRARATCADEAGATPQPLASSRGRHPTTVPVDPATPEHDQASAGTPQVLRAPPATPPRSPSSGAPPGADAVSRPSPV